MDESATRILICPHCGGDLRQNGASLICSKGHTANVARQGYVSLLGRRSGTHTADSAEMLEARERILGAGHFEPVAAAIREEITKAGLEGVDGAVVDLGTGTGWYLAAALDALPGKVGIGVDNSKYAARRAARVHDRAAAVVADIWDEVPVKDGAAALVLNLFSPRNGEEIDRILADGGRLVVVTPTGEHLKELIEPFGMISVDPDKEQRLARTLGDQGDPPEARKVAWTMELGPGEVRDLVGMGPSAGRLAAEDLDHLVDALPESSPVTGSVRILVR